MSEHPHQPKDDLEDKIYEILYKHEGDLSDGYGYYGGERDVLLISEEIANLIRSRPSQHQPLKNHFNCDHKKAYDKNGIRYCDECMTAWEIPRSRPSPAPAPLLQDGEDPESICKRKPICAHYPCGMEKIDSYCGMKMRMYRQARAKFAQELIDWRHKMAQSYSIQEVWEFEHSYLLESLRQEP